jgi:DNA-binding MarR family transcriptional regulator
MSFKFLFYICKKNETMPARTIYLIKRAETEITAHMTKILGEFEITPMQFTILNFVQDNPDDLSSAQLSRRFLMTPQSMNEAIGTMQRKELLEKYTDPKHKRILRINLTEKGLEKLKICNGLMDGFEENLFLSFNTEELAACRHFMGKILNEKR